MTRTQTSVARLSLALVVSLVGLGCTVLVSGDPPAEIACRPVAGGPDPCFAALGTGYRCSSSDPMTTGQCMNTCDMAEICNGEDDDCDGMTDEGLDADSDGYTWCPTGPSELDCDDDDADVNPGRGDDPCDGIDNDCKPSTLDGSSQCSGGQICDPQMGCVNVHCGLDPSICTSDRYCDRSTEPPSCQLTDASCFATPCTAPARCNPDTGTCVPGDVPVGGACNYDSECQTSLCVPRQASRIPADIAVGSVGVCSRMCCSDSDCGSSELCWASGTGTQVCLPRAIFGGSTHGAPSSAVCSSGGDCPDVCRATVDDAYETANRVAAECISGNMNDVTCTAGRDILGYYDSCWGMTGRPYCIGGTCGVHDCVDSSDCDSGACVGSICVDGCGRTEDCRAGVSGSAFEQVYCSYRTLTVDGQRGVRPVCTYAPRGTGRTGTTCTSDGDCRDRTCIDSRGRTTAVDLRCADTCCHDEHCGPSEQCRPTYAHGNWEMHCLTRPTFSVRGTPP